MLNHQLLLCESFFRQSLFFCRSFGVDGLPSISKFPCTSLFLNVKNWLEIICDFSKWHCMFEMATLSSFYRPNKTVFYITGRWENPEKDAIKKIYKINDNEWSP